MITLKNLMDVMCQNTPKAYRIIDIWASLLDKHPRKFIFIVACMVMLYRPDVVFFCHLIAVLVLSASILDVMKMVVRRGRGEIKSSQDFRMPSFHSGVGMALSVTVISYDMLFGTIWVVFAAMAGYGRIHDGSHKIDEVIVGFIVGILVAILLVWYKSEVLRGI